MQFFKLSQELITDKNITSNEFRIYTYLMSLYNTKQDCSFPSMETIVEKLGMTKPTVNKSIKKLVKLGYMVVEKQKAKIGNYNKYKNFKHIINPDTEESLTEASKAEMEVDNIVEIQESKREPLIVSDYKESGVQISIEDVEEVKIKQHPNNSKIAKAFENSKSFKLSKWLLDRVAYIDETIVDIVLEEKPKTAKLFLVKCIERTIQAGLELAPIIENTLNKYSKTDMDYAGAGTSQYSCDFYMKYAHKQLGI